jgi:pyrroloquinoline quinone biosynthesis protein D
MSASPDPDFRPRLAENVRLQTDRVTGEPVLLYPEGVLVLNETAHDIVTRCTGTATVGEIVSGLAAEYDAAPEELAGDVLECLGDLRRRQFIVSAS